MVPPLPPPPPFGPPLPPPHPPRPAELVGAAVDTLLARHFAAPRLLGVRRCAPRWQFCHVDDLGTALELAAAGMVAGAFAVGCDGSPSQAEVELQSGLKSVELPA